MERRCSECARFEYDPAIAQRQCSAKWDKDLSPPNTTLGFSYDQKGKSEEQPGAPCKENADEQQFDGEPPRPAYCGCINVSARSM